MDVDVLTRNNVTAGGRADGQAIVFAHGYGCDQNMWRFVAPAFEGRYRTIMFDFVGAAALAFQHGPARDDIAVVVVKVPAPGRG